MTLKRISIIFIILAIGLGSTAFLPRVENPEPSGIYLKLPEFIGMWHGVHAEVTERERTILGPHTQFARKDYSDPFGNHLFVSIVLAGTDMNRSIHRPERCLPAQGWTIIGTSGHTIPIAEDHHLPVTRLYNTRRVELKNGKTMPIYNLDYYWFIGYHDVTRSHLHRELVDIKDRIFKGYSQRWAFVTVASNISKSYQPFGKDEKQTDAMIQKFIKQLVPKIDRGSVVYQ